MKHQILSKILAFVSLKNAFLIIPLKSVFALTESNGSVNKNAPEDAVAPGRVSPEVAAERKVITFLIKTHF